MSTPAIQKYSLKGPQVDPGASYWMYCSQLHALTIQELTQLTEDQTSNDFFPAPPNADVTAKEFDELLQLAPWRDDPCKLVNIKPCKKPELTPCKSIKELPQAFGCRRPISKLLNLTPPALGAVVVNRFPAEQIIRTGRGMARAVEAETPGIFHRHALNFLISTRSWSPPFQGLVWAALDVAIASALQAAWYYKWVNKRTAFRERPVEYARRIKKEKDLNVLFDRPDELNPAYNRCPDGRPDMNGNFLENDSGTPRHPAYPSGHSTYSAAASEILNFFFGLEDTPSFLIDPGEPKTKIGQELNNLADNIGLGRMWAGIHWRSDHEAGGKLGRTVACLVLQQLARMESKLPNGFVMCPPEIPMLENQCVPRDDKADKELCDETKMPPTREQLEQEAKQLQNMCKSQIYPNPLPPIKLPKQCPPSPEPIEQRRDASRGVQRGAK
jgi:hypothetical protein